MWPWSDDETQDPASGLSQMLGGDDQSAQGWIDMAMGQSGGDVSGANELLERLRNSPGYDMNNAPLRDASHELFSRAMIQEHPVIGYAPAAAAPAYSLAKYLMQSVLPTPVAQVNDALLGRLGLPPLYNASRPSFSEAWHGIKPLFQR